MFQPIGLRFSPSNQSCKALGNQSSSSLTNQDSAFGTNQTEDLVLICMKMDQSRTEGGDSVHTSQLPLASPAYFPFPLKIEDCVSLAELNNWRCLIRARQTAHWGAEQSCVARKGPGPRAAWPSTVLLDNSITIELFHIHAVFTAMLHHSWAVCIE